MVTICLLYLLLLLARGDGGYCMCVCLCEHLTVYMRLTMTTTTKIDDMPQHFKTHMSRWRWRRRRRRWWRWRQRIGIRGSESDASSKQQAYKSCHSFTSAIFGINREAYVIHRDIMHIYHPPKWISWGYSGVSLLRSTRYNLLWWKRIKIVFEEAKKMSQDSDAAFHMMLRNANRIPFRSRSLSPPSMCVCSMRPHDHMSVCHRICVQSFHADV